MISITGVLLLLTHTTYGAVEYGIAGGYPSDVGLDADSRVVFSEDFETGTMADIRAKWGYSNGSWHNNMVFDSDIPNNSGGLRSFRSNGISDLYTQLLPEGGAPGYEQLYVRFYFKLDSGTCDRIHHWVWMGGHDIPTSYPWPRAGEDPWIEDRSGVNTAGRFSTGIEQFGTGGSWTWNYYTYWPAMHQSGGGPPNYWGNSFLSEGGWGNPSPFPVVRDQWTSIEFMVKMNTFQNSAGLEDGEQAFWINGELKSYIGSTPDKQVRGSWQADSFIQNPSGPVLPGIAWRTTRPNLLINYLWLEHFVDTDPGQDCIGWYDDLVVATEYIGPMVASVVNPPPPPPPPPNTCADADNDGHTAASCGGDDCNDTNTQVHPGAQDFCGDGVDQDCSGADVTCPPPNDPPPNNQPEPTDSTTVTMDFEGTCAQAPAGSVFVVLLAFVLMRRRS